MRIAVMQPYFFPYIGYWQLIGCVDTFVLFDDVNYINRGWINRNRILSNKIDYIRLPLLGASQNKKINEVRVNLDDLFSKRNTKIIHETYRKAPYYKEIMPLIEKWMYIENDLLSEYLGEQIRMISRTLGIENNTILSSSIEGLEKLRREDRIIAICRNLGADKYYNPVGGVGLYDKGIFKEKGVDLFFISPNLTPYKQFGTDFIPSLSIIDMLMFCGLDYTRNMLKDYSI
ncbi:MAG: hypothetical protein E7271_07230 [Lachnospiraceae bacterium]|jgi:hypothetical protein|nr:hypothetical protein [Lachnospiraceae bacterium]